MGKPLTKPWNRAAAGTVITTDPEEARMSGATLVDPVRFARLEADGHFAEQPDAGEAKTPEPVKTVVMQQPASPKPLEKEAS